MTKTLLLLFCALAVCGLARAADGEAVVPAHRTEDGSLVPANVPPASGGTHLARRPGKSGRAAPARASPAARAAAMPPIFTEAPPMRP
jgi:hypothetical protein